MLFNTNGIVPMNQMLFDPAVDPLYPYIKVLSCLQF